MRPRDTWTQKAQSLLQFVGYCLYMPAMQVDGLIGSSKECTVPGSGSSLERCDCSQVGFWSIRMRISMIMGLSKHGFKYLIRRVMTSVDYKLRAQIFSWRYSCQDGSEHFQV